MQTTVYLIRHGEIHNPNNILYGRLPKFGLTEKGKEQIKQTANFLKDKQIEILYASPLQRAKESTAIIRESLTLPTIYISEQIIEIKTSYQGWKMSDLDPAQEDIYRKPLDASDETIEQIADRMQQFIDQLIKIYPSKHIAAVSHGDPIMVLKAVIKQKTPDLLSFKTDHYIQHGEIYKITSEGDNLSITSVFKPANNA